MPRDIGEILSVYTIRASPFMHFARSFGHVSCTTNAPLPHHNNDMGQLLSRAQASSSPCGAKEALFA